MGQLKTLALSALLLSPGSAWAFCPQGYGSDFAGKVSGYIDYLICLHNEQNKVLNQHAAMLNDHAFVINEQAASMDKYASSINELIKTQDKMIAAMAALEQENRRLTARVNSLETRLLGLE